MQDFPQDLPTRFSRKIFPQDFPARFSELDPDWLAPHHPIPNAKFPLITAFLKLAFSPPPFPTRISRKIVPQEFPTRFSCKIFPQDFPARFSHKIVPQEFPTRFSCKIFPQEFPARFSHKIFLQDFPELDPDWLAPHHPIPNAKFPPITVLLNRPTYHKRSKVSPPPFPQILWEPQINE